MSEQDHATVLIVDDDPAVRASLRENVFWAGDFLTVEAKDGPDALTQLGQQPPDLVMLDLKLPGLSGHDLLIAMRSSGYQGPVIVMDGDDDLRAVVEAFRLGATDYVTKPIREAEVAAAVEHGLAEVRLRRERDSLIAELQDTNEQLTGQVNALTTLYNIGETVVALRNLENVFSHVLEGAIELTGADHALLLLRDDRSGNLILRAGHNLPLNLLDRLGGVVQDELANLVMHSREPLVVAGEGLRRFKVGRDLFAVAYVPLTVQTASIGVLAVGNHQTEAPFSEEDGWLLKTLANFAAIAVVSARLSYMLEQRNTQIQQAYQALKAQEAERREQWLGLLVTLRESLDSAEEELQQLAAGVAQLSDQAIGHRLDVVMEHIHQMTAQIQALEPDRKE